MPKQPHVFISYARVDGAEFANQLYVDLQSRNIATWQDIHEIKAGELFYNEIADGIRNAVALIVIITPGAVISSQVTAEWNNALNLHIPIIPLLIKDCTVPPTLAILNWIDFRDQYTAGFAMLRRRLSSLFHDHLRYLQRQKEQYEIAQTTTSQPIYKTKIGELGLAINRWQMLFSQKEEQIQEQEKHRNVSTNGGGYRGDMNQLFVARKEEIKRLNQQLVLSLDAQLQVCLVSGEAGTGKSSLVYEFAKQVEKNHKEILVVVGNCNAQTGASEGYLPFRQILAQLTGDIASRRQITQQGSNRLNQMLKTSGRMLLEVAPELVGSLIPGAGILVSLGKMTAKERGLLTGLEERAEQAEKYQIDYNQSQIVFQYTAFLNELSSMHPLVIILDDLQWADEASINLFFHLSRELTNSQIFLLGLYRPNDIALGRHNVRHPMVQTIHELKRYRGDIVIDLDQIQNHAGRYFVDALLDTESNEFDDTFRVKLYERTGGHPLFTVELVRSMQDNGFMTRDDNGHWMTTPELSWDKLPTRVEAIIEERVERLQEELRELLTVASVEGMNFTVQILSQLQGMSERNLVKKLSQELDRRHRLVYEFGEIKIGQRFLSQFAFSHALFHHYLYNTLTIAERRMLHREVAELLKNLHEGITDNIAPQLAHHYAEAGDIGQAISYSFVAVINGLRIGALTEAKDNLLLISKLLEENGNSDQFTQEKAKLLFYRGEIEYLLGKRSEAIVSYQSSIDMYDYLSPCIDKAFVLNAIGRYYLALYNLVRAEACFSQALQLALRLNHAETQSFAYRNLGLIYMRKGDAHEAEVYLAKSLTIAQENTIYVEMTRTLNSLGLISNSRGQHTVALDNFNRALELSKLTGYQNITAMITDNMATVHIFLGDYHLAEKHVLEALELNKRSGIIIGQGYRLARLSHINWLNKNNDSAMTFAQEGIQLGKKVNDAQIISISGRHLAKVFLSLGQFIEAIEVLTDDQVLTYKPYRHVNLSLYVLALAGSNNDFPLQSAAMNALTEIEEYQKTKLDRFQAYFFKGLVHIALTLVSATEKDKHINQAFDAYQNALEITKAKGVLEEHLKYLDIVKQVDKDNFIGPIRQLLIDALETR